MTQGVDYAEEAWHMRKTTAKAEGQVGGSGGKVMRPETMIREVTPPKFGASLAQKCAGKPGDGQTTRRGNLAGKNGQPS